MSLKDKVAIITGSSSGIGAEIAKTFSREGAKIVITARREDRLQSLAAECAGGDANVHVVVGDITDELIQKKIVDEAVAKFGGIDILVNNAGMGVTSPVDPGVDDSLKQKPEDKLFGLAAYDKQFNINVRQVVGLTTLAIPHIVKRKGNIINISSVASKRTFNKMSFYCMTKAAIDSLTASLCVELGPLGVRVNSINPGFIKTEFMDALGVPAEDAAAMAEKFIQMHPIRRAGEPVDIAEAAVYLASNKAGFVTGSSLTVDGGILQTMG